MTQRSMQALEKEILGSARGAGEALWEESHILPQIFFYGVDPWRCLAACPRSVCLLAEKGEWNTNGALPHLVRCSQGGSLLPPHLSSPALSLSHSHTPSLLPSFLSLVIQQTFRLTKLPCPLCTNKHSLRHEGDVGLAFQFRVLAVESIRLQFESLLSQQLAVGPALVM